MEASLCAILLVGEEAPSQRVSFHIGSPTSSRAFLPPTLVCRRRGAGKLAFFLRKSSTLKTTSESSNATSSVKALRTSRGLFEVFTALTATKMWEFLAGSVDSDVTIFPALHY